MFLFFFFSERLFWIFFLCVTRVIITFTESLVNLKESVSLRDKARLNTIGTPETGAWLWAVPNPNLGLTMSRQDVSLSLSMWLGCRICPHPVRCVCRQTIDEYGDHVLGCGHGQLRIKRHDALCEVAWHTLLMDNRGVIREQWCAQVIISDQETCFILISVWASQGTLILVKEARSLQSQFLSKALEYPGQTGDAGEIDKDGKHEEEVNAASFILSPYCGELGLWITNSHGSLN